MQLLANKNKLNYLIQTFILKNKLRNFRFNYVRLPIDAEAGSSAQPGELRD